MATRPADLLIRTKSGRRLPVCRRLPDRSYVSRIGPVEVRVVRAEITIATSAGRRSEVYQLVTTVLDTEYTAAEIVRLYHERWEIETAFLELKQTILGGRVLRARTPAGIDQEIYALLVTYQAPRIAIADATLGELHVDPDRASFTIALNTARDQLIAAAGVIADTITDLVGVIGRHVLDNLMAARRLRTTPRVVKRAISNYTVKTANAGSEDPAQRSLSRSTSSRPQTLDNTARRLTTWA
jgi:Transposase DDE domain